MANSFEDFQLKRKERNEDFDAELDSLQQRLGYRFKNKELLIQALTARGFAEQIGERHNTRLEARGDDILERRVNAWLTQHPFGSYRGYIYLNGFLNSNLYLSSAGVRLGIDRGVRVNEARAQSQSVETKIRMTADAMEAIIAAIEDDGGRPASIDFMEAHLLPESVSDSPLGRFVGLCSGDPHVIEQTFNSLLRGRAKLEMTKQGRDFHAVIKGVDLPDVPSSHSDAAHAAHRAVMTFLRQNPWVLWGFDGPVSQRAPSMAWGAYPEYVEQSLPKEVRTPEYIEDPYLSVPHREEEGWPDIEIPALLPESTRDRGPYIDKLRCVLEGKTVVVRSKKIGKEQFPRYAFYVDKNFLTTVEGRRTLNDAASQALRELAEIEAEGIEDKEADELPVENSPEPESQ